jgi:hypothetical protein
MKVSFRASRCFLNKNLYSCDREHCLAGEKVGLRVRLTLRVVNNFDSDEKSD